MTGTGTGNITQQTAELWEKTFQTPYTLPIDIKASPQIKSNENTQELIKDNPFYKRNGDRKVISKDDSEYKGNTNREEIKTRIATATVHNQR